MAGYLYIFANSEIYVKLIEKLSRRHLINSSEVFVIKGFTVRTCKGSNMSRVYFAFNKLSYSQLLSLLWNLYKVQKR